MVIQYKPFNGKDFVIELTTWFRRVIWFLGFTSATTLSPGLFLTAATMAVIFELVYNITNARMYWDSVVGYNDHDRGNINYVDDYDKLDYYDYYEYPISRRSPLNSFYMQRFKQPVSTVNYRSKKPYMNTLISRQNLVGRREGMYTKERDDDVKDDSKFDNWRYLLGLPPWFMKD